MVVPHKQKYLVAAVPIHGRNIIEYAGHGCARGSVQDLIAKGEKLVKNVRASGVPLTAIRVETTERLAEKTTAHGPPCGEGRSLNIGTNFPQGDCVHVIVMEPIGAAPVEDTLGVGVILHSQRGGRPDTAHLEAASKPPILAQPSTTPISWWRISRREGATPSRNRVPASVSCVAAMIPHPSGEASEQETTGEVAIRRSAVMTGSRERHMTSSSNRSTPETPPRKLFGPLFESNWNRHWSVRVVENAQGRTKETGLPAPAASQNLQQLTGNGTRKKTVRGAPAEDPPGRLGRGPQADSRGDDPSASNTKASRLRFCGNVNLPVVVLGLHLVQCLAGLACFGGGLVEVRETPQVEFVEIDNPQETFLSHTSAEGEEVSERSSRQEGRPAPMGEGAVAIRRCAYWISPGTETNPMAGATEAM